MIFNDYEIAKDHVIIFCENKNLNKVYECLIDLQDLEKVKSFGVKWMARGSGDVNQYVSLYGTSISIHRFLTDAPPGKVVDHINHNTLDNRRRNIRVVSQQENVHNNLGVKAKSASGIRNVYPCRRTGKWQACVMLDRKNHHLGYFDDKYDALGEVLKFKRERNMFFYDQ